MIEEMKTTRDKLVQIQVQHDELQIRIQEIENNCLENISGKPKSDSSKMKGDGRQPFSSRVNVNHKKNKHIIRKMKDVKKGNELCEFEKKNVLQKFRQLQVVDARQKRKLGKSETHQHEAINDDRKEIGDKQTFHEMLEADQGSVKTKQPEMKESSKH
jgi:hypothetical protein